MDKNKKINFVLAFSVAFLFVVMNAQAATYYSIKPGNEVCTSIIFGLNGGGEYTLIADYPGEGSEPWIDNHFTSFVAGPDNIISVPVCFSAIGRGLGDEVNIKIIITTPRGNITHDYGVCVARYDDVDIVGGPAEGSPCKAMGENTDIFSAGFSQPEMYAQPGSAATYTLVLDASTAMTVSIAKASGDVTLRASESSVILGDGQKDVQVQLTAPSSPGDYTFSVLVSVEECSISDCRREVNGILHVASASGTPQAGFFVWLTPETKSIMGQQGTQFVIRVQNYGEGQEITALVSVDDGIETDFSPYTTFLKKGESKSVPFNVRPATAERKTYKLTAVVQGTDGTKRSAKSWLTVDEMVADASKLGQNGFIDDYDDSGGATLEEWEELKSLTGNVIYDDSLPLDETPAAPDYMFYIIIAVVAGVIAVLGFFIYKKTQVQSEGGTTWEDLGLK